MIITDTHTHLYLKEFDSDREQVINHAINSNVSRLFLPAIDSSYTKSMLDLKQKFPENIFIMAGLHPCYIQENYLEEINHVEENITNNYCVAVGEIGIDMYWRTDNLSIQKEVFSMQIRLAKKYKLPIVIHSRDSYNEIFKDKDALIISSVDGSGSNAKGSFDLLSVQLKNYGLKVYDEFYLFTEQETVDDLIEKDKNEEKFQNFLNLFLTI